MQRHMQNISFLAIVAVLLGCAFFFSQQTKLEEQNPEKEVDTIAAPVTLDDVPACSVELEGDESLAFLIESVETSERLVESMVDQILAEETDTERRISFRKVQFSWEESRNTECAYVGEMDSDKDLGEIEEAVCLRDRNLERYEQLKGYLCEWYQGDSCQDNLSADD